MPSLDQVVLSVEDVTLQGENAFTLTVGDKLTVTREKNGESVTVKVLSISAKAPESGD